MPGPRPRLVVALDGPASSGKSSVGAAAARDLGYRFCDTGLLYRALTSLALRQGVDLGDAAGLVPLVDEVQLAADGGGSLSRVLVDGVDVTDAVRGPEVDRSVSELSRVPEVRAALLARQRALAEPGRIVMAGRDIGTVVLPGADLKIFLDASAGERARRRAEERGLAPDSAEAAAILADLLQRDSLDRDRPVAPLRAADDALVIATDGNTFDQTVAKVKGLIRIAENKTSHEARVPERHRPLGDGLTWLIRATDAFGRFVWRFLARVELHGLDRVRDLEGPVLLVANHVSNADAPLIGSFVTPALGRRIYWLGKQEALDWPIVGKLIELNAVIGIQRGAADVEAFRSAKRVLDEGHVLIVFPEGTRSPTGALQEAKEGTTILALRSGARIVPIGVSGTRRVWPRGQRLPHPTRHRVVLRVGEPFTISAPGAGAERRAAQVAATTVIMGRIAALLPSDQRGVYAAAAVTAAPAPAVGPEPAEGSPKDPVR
ncbi:MAG: (d)CMP kinase [Candidatus Limnocylindrales bacterium]